MASCSSLFARLEAKGRNDYPVGVLWGTLRFAIALRHHKGARYVEEILLAAIVEERGSLTNFIPSPVSIERIEDEPEPLDLQIF